MALVTTDGTEYPYSTTPGANPDFLAAGATFDTVGYTKRIAGWSSFALPRSTSGALVLKVSVDGSGRAPVYFHIGDCPTWCGGLPN